eukprot:5675560-Prymnesium_polylepis.1
MAQRSALRQAAARSTARPPRARPSLLDNRYGLAYAPIQPATIGMSRHTRRVPNGAAFGSLARRPGV